MPKLTFYRQKRFDGGIRTGVELAFELDGVEIGDRTIMEDFEPGDGERDPTLLWYVDVRCEGQGVPDEHEEVGRWLIETAPLVQSGLERFADRLRRVGSDVDEYPLESHDPADENGVIRTISCTAIRRLDARGLADILDDTRNHWVDRVATMIDVSAAKSP